MRSYLKITIFLTFSAMLFASMLVVTRPTLASYTPQVGDKIRYEESEFNYMELYLNISAYNESNDALLHISDEFHNFIGEMWSENIMEIIGLHPPNASFPENTAEVTIDSRMKFNESGVDEVKDYFPENDSWVPHSFKFSSPIHEENMTSDFLIAYNETYFPLDLPYIIVGQPDFFAFLEFLTPPPAENKSATFESNSLNQEPPPPPPPDEFRILLNWSDYLYDNETFKINDVEFDNITVHALIAEGELFLDNASLFIPFGPPPPPPPPPPENISGSDNGDTQLAPPPPDIEINMTGYNITIDVFFEIGYDNDERSLLYFTMYWMLDIEQILIQGNGTAPESGWPMILNGTGSLYAERNYWLDMTHHSRLYGGYDFSTFAPTQPSGNATETAPSNTSASENQTGPAQNTSLPVVTPGFELPTLLLSTIGVTTIFILRKKRTHK